MSYETTKDFIDEYDDDGKVPVSKLGDGTADETKFLRGDRKWEAPTASAAWGSITGTLSDQTDLKSALDGRALTG